MRTAKCGGQYAGIALLQELLERGIGQERQIACNDQPGDIGEGGHGALWIVAQRWLAGDGTDDPATIGHGDRRLFHAKLDAQVRGRIGFEFEQTRI